MFKLFFFFALLAMAYAKPAYVAAPVAAYTSLGYTAPVAYSAYSAYSPYAYAAAPAVSYTSPYAAYTLLR